MNPRPYVSIDIETTGWDKQKSQVLEIAAIIDIDFTTPVDQLPSVRLLIDNDPISYSEPYAMSMHPELLRDIADSLHNSRDEYPDTAEICKPNINFKTFNASQASTYLTQVFKMWNTQYNSNHKRLIAAGKNFASFDLSIMENQGIWSREEFGVDGCFLHRYYDVGNFYAKEFGYPPSLDEVNNKLGREKVSHKALDDCKDVIYAIRHHFRS